MCAEAIRSAKEGGQPEETAEPQDAPRSISVCRGTYPWLVILVGLLITAGLFLSARKAALNDSYAEFGKHAAPRAAMIVRELDEGMLITRSVGRFCQEGRVTRKEFSAFVAPLLRQYPQLGSVVWVPKTVGARDASYERAARRQGSGEPKATGLRDLTYPVPAIQPPSSGRSATSRDLDSDHIIRSVANRARDSGEPEAVDNGFGITVVLPVYQKRPLSSLTDRRGALRGFVFATLKSDEIFSTFLTAMDPEGFTAEFLDLSAGHGGKRIHRWSGPAAGSPPSWTSHLLPPFPTYMVRFFSGKEWAIRISPNRGYMETRNSLAYWLLLPGGVVVTLLLSLLTFCLGTILSQKKKLAGVSSGPRVEARDRAQHLARPECERAESGDWKSIFLTEEAPGRKEATLRSVFSAFPVGISLVTGDRMTKWTNEGMTTIRGYSTEETEDLEPRNEYLSDEEFTRVYECVCGDIRQGKVGTADTRWVQKDGRILDIHISAAAIDPEDLSAGVIFTAVDTSDHKKAEEAWRESEERYRIAIDNSNDGIALAAEGRNHFVNRRFLEIFGYDREEDAVGEKKSCLCAPGRYRASAARGKKKKQWEEAPGRYEFKGIKRDGTAVDLEVTVAPVTYRSKKVFLVHFHDITERKKAEEALRESENKFRDLAEKSIVGVYLIQDGLFRYVNSRFAEIHGYAPEELIDRMGVEKTVAQEDIGGVQESIRIRMSGEVDLVRHEFRIVTKQGNVRDVEVYGTHTVYQGRTAIMGTLLDVTERRRTEAMLSRKTAFLEAQVNSSLDGILVIDNQGRRILQNQRTVDMWKIPQHLLDDRGDRTWFSHMAGMAKRDRRFRRKADHLGRRPEETSRDEVELTDGTILDTYSCPVLGEDGNCYGRIWTFRDITELRHYWDMLESLSATDGLTDLPNRRRFDDFLNREWRRSIRDQSLLSLILMDIDFFKEFNDHYGHLAGDDCLRQVAGMLSEVVQGRAIWWPAMEAKNLPVSYPKLIPPAQSLWRTESETE